ncbi:cobaltochelatase subunit CobN [Aquisalimonas lutea]|uniref:cobaltochelatase subunit CobN n=1 Tax=Aquisalimonas lutea TaxID=1327750 RepID=UPI0025B4E3A9|nr:cobaltochelatase subunit CobN [Aquisalimonas lutea]MDN3519538.1 cobaltochelatase subunit CobN [Aquisalimonas lutea]
MHMLSAQPGGFNDEQGIVDLAQSPGELVILAAADGTLGLLADAAEDLPEDYPGVRLANWLNLTQPAALDLYRHKVIDHARVVVVSLLGGSAYWPYGLEQLQEWAAGGDDRTLIVVPGDDSEDAELLTGGTVDEATARRVWQYLREGGDANAAALYRYLGAACLGRDDAWMEPRVLPRTLVYHPDHGRVELGDWHADWQLGAPVALVLFYRSHLQAANMDMFDGLIAVLQESGLNPLPVAVASLKEDACLEAVNALAREGGADILLNTTGFALQAGGDAAMSSHSGARTSPFSRDMPLLQLIIASCTRDDWQEHTQGLRGRDIAMHIALPELDGRIITRAVSFKSASRYSERCQLDVVRYELHPERARFVATLARRWCLLRSQPNDAKRIALVLANYPTRDGRIGNGVGLDTPQSTLTLLHAMAAAGYPVADLPENATALIEHLQSGVTNSTETLDTSPCYQSLDVQTYRAWFATLPDACQQAVRARWGEPEADPKYRDGRLMVAGVRLGETFVGIQPARGYNIDLSANYHDPDLVPPHGYLAFYCWLREVYGVSAVVHVGKHGNLEWLPGKGTALSDHCWPDIALGAMPQLYPFIVNDPGEGAQAKRRTQAVIVDHMTPPLSRAETHGELAELERLVDEYYQALGLDPRREEHLRQAIVDHARSSHIAEELPPADTREAADPDPDAELLRQLDGYLCDIKEAQIRDGLHCLGELPPARSLRDTLVALVRLPRGDAPEDAGVLHALAADLGLDGDFDPLKADASPWRGPRPEVLAAVSEEPWRHGYDTRERLEILAARLVAGTVLGHDDGMAAPPEWTRTAVLLDHLQRVVHPALAQGVGDEIDHCLAGLAGRFVPPGPSGAPTRGRLDTLPTGRNFYAVDSRAIPTKTAWELGQASAEALVRRHLQEHGEYPEQIGLSVWGTATMRTGGDDIAQAFALLGVRPIWAAGSNRVVDFEVMPNFLLRRPRIDVTLRVSGFFRDAFPNVIRLFDAAVQKLAGLREPGDSNTIRAHVEARCEALEAEGADADSARRQAAFRVFGSRPGAYGAGLQGPIDERCWDDGADLARAYINWGGYAYGQDAEGEEAFDTFAHRLGQLDAVIHNQDNREHDILDSDDYYQFQGGMTNAVREMRGTAPSTYHNDHSNPAAPKVRTLKEELNRVVRSRVTNPKWIAAMQRHGYKGAAEMAASVDYLFAYDATTGIVDDYQYANVSDALVFDADNRRFLEAHNREALREMGERFLEAMQRGLWAEPGDYREAVESVLLELAEAREGAATASDTSDLARSS